MNACDISEGHVWIRDTHTRQEDPLVNDALRSESPSLCRVSDEPPSYQETIDEAFDHEAPPSYLSLAIEKPCPPE